MNNQPTLSSYLGAKRGAYYSVVIAAFYEDLGGTEMTGLPPRNDLRDHSPDGFAWGYGGSGPAQLALAICAHATENRDRALAVYQSFKAEYIATLDPNDGFELAREDALTMIEAIESGQPCEKRIAQPNYSTAGITYPARRA